MQIGATPSSSAAAAASETYVNLETTLEEIAYVWLSGIVDPIDPTVATCFTGAAWALLLPAYLPPKPSDRSASTFETRKRLFVIAIDHVGQQGR